MSDRSIRDVIARYLSGDARFQPTPGDYTDADEMLALLDIHDDAILDRDCETCGSNEPDAPWIQNCPDCDGTGRQPVAKVMVVPIEVADAIRDGHVFTSLVHECCTRPDPADAEKALRIGRAVMASQPLPGVEPGCAGSTGDIPYAWGYNSARVEFLAAGEVEG